MNFVSGTFLTQPDYIQTQLGTMILHETSGMGKLISELRKGTRPDARILYAKKEDLILAWCSCTDTPWFYWNQQDNPNRPEVQIYVRPELRRQGLGRSLISQARTLWGSFSTCAWSQESHEFFRAVR